MHETYIGTSMPITEFWVSLWLHHTELSLSAQTLLKQPTANLVSSRHRSGQYASSRHGKMQHSASKLNHQLFQFISKNLKPIPCVRGCQRKLPLCLQPTRFLSCLIFPRCSIPCTVCFPVCNINLMYLGFHPLFAIANS